MLLLIENFPLLLRELLVVINVVEDREPLGVFNDVVDRELLDVVNVVIRNLLDGVNYCCQKAFTCL